MDMSPDLVFRKSAEGQHELKARTAGLDATARALLILVNGQSTLAALESKLGRTIAQAAQLLWSKALIERAPDPASAISTSTSTSTSTTATAAPAAAPPAAPRVSPAAERPQVEPAAAPAPLPDDTARWNALRREVVKRLAPHFGSDLPTVLVPLMQANTEATVQAALAALQTKLALYQGKKAAAKLFEGLQP